MAEPEGEIFEIFDAEGHLIGVEKRSIVHRLGLWHRSVDVFVFCHSEKNELCLVLQKRSAEKVVCPQNWDLSCAEHLSMGEEYIDGAVRGLKEELGLVVEKEQLRMFPPICISILL
jgi:isopentenyldiphosphate isomerase